MLTIKNLTKDFRDIRALDDVSFTIERGQVYGLLGPNGAGKTTLIKHISGVYRQNAGEVKLDDIPIYENAKIKSKIIYVSDELFFFTQYSIADMAHYYAHLYPDWNWERFKKLGDVFHLNPKKRITKMSKGMQKQAAFWLGSCAMPDLFVLDEPVDGLDPIMRKTVWNIILSDVTERNTTVMISSHNLRELEDVCDHIGILHHGKLILNKELDSAKSDIHKLQLAYRDKLPEDTIRDYFKDIEILHHSVSGSIIIIVAKGDREDIIKRINRTNPLLLDILPLSLEEIFIHEVSDINHEIRGVLF